MDTTTSITRTKKGIRQKKENRKGLEEKIELMFEEKNKRDLTII